MIDLEQKQKRKMKVIKGLLLTSFLLVTFISCKKDSKKFNKEVVAFGTIPEYNNKKISALSRDLSACTDSCNDVCLSKYHEFSHILILNARYEELMPFAKKFSDECNDKIASKDVYFCYLKDHSIDDLDCDDRKIALNYLIKAGVEENFEVAIYIEEGIIVKKNGLYQIVGCE